jgi:trimethylamine--corrinoid protein Co-methyltransferase
MISPLRCAEEQGDALLEAARWGLPIEVVAPPCMGLTGPITLAGSAVLALAEVVAALCLVYLVAPGLGIINTARISPTNMLTGSCNYGAPELGMASALAAACAARYRIPTDAYGLGTAARMPGAQATMEKTLSGLLMALGHPYMVTGGGSLNSALATSPEQLVADHEIIRFIKRICETIRIDEETIGIDVLTEAMRSQGHLMGEEHTVKHFRAGEMLNCSLGQWDSQNEWEAAGHPDLLARAHRKVREILDTHSVAPFEAQVGGRIESIVGRYC